MKVENRVLNDGGLKSADGSANREERKRLGRKPGGRSSTVGGSLP